MFTESLDPHRIENIEKSVEGQGYAWENNY